MNATASPLSSMSAREGKYKIKNVIIISVPHKQAQQISSLTKKENECSTNIVSFHPFQESDTVALPAAVFLDDRLLLHCVQTLRYLSSCVDA